MGGYPLEVVGYTIERYDFEKDYWEVVNLRLHAPCVSFGLYPASYNRMVVFGGRFSTSIAIVEIHDYNS